MAQPPGGQSGLVGIVGTLSVVSVLGVAGVVSLRFNVPLELPPLPPKPPPPKADVMRNSDFSPHMYEAYLAKDAATYGVSPTTAAEMARPLTYGMIAVDKTLPAGGELDLPTVKLSLRVEELKSSTTRGSFRTAHSILKIQNKTSEALAYRIETMPSIGTQTCLSKGDFPHNAVVLAPGETLERTECVHRDGSSVTVKQVETMSVSPLSYHYLSRLYPADIGLDRRTSRGHRPPIGEPCTDIPEQAIRQGMDAGSITWRDVIDFYARHRCDTYVFPKGYRAFSKAGEHPLPVSAQSLAGPSR